ncbi:MAG: alpha-amylase, partial [Candidatus Omnitrophica bacterium]|nr:alpha-amylase [Candidatus Omnitrophota bacterium]
MRKHPQLLELNAFFFISRMSKKYGRRLTLATVPVSEWKLFAEQGFDYLWLMGVWTRSPGSAAHAAKEPGLCRAYDLILPDWKREDVTGSPYAIFGYQLDPYLGRPEELLQLKMKLNGLGLGLILDFVPNHLAFDHPWTAERPELFVSCSPETLRAHPEWSFITANGKKLAHGRDPYFAPWIDTVQINFWSPQAREAWLTELLKISQIADGVRCDMAMLGLNDVFQKVWGDHIAQSRPYSEFWEEVIPEVKKIAPNFI